MYIPVANMPEISLFTILVAHQNDSSFALEKDMPNVMATTNIAEVRFSFVLLYATETSSAESLHACYNLY